MKRFKQVCSFLLALTLIVGLMPGIRLPAKAAAPAVNDNVLHASHAENGVTVDGTLDGDVVRLNIPLSATMKFGAAWDWKNLYLTFTDTVAPEVTALTVNGQAVTEFGTAGTGVREIQIPLADVGIEDIDFAEGYTLSVTVGGVTWEGKLVFDTTNYSPLAVNGNVTIHDQNTWQITQDGMGVIAQDDTSKLADKRTRWMYNSNAVLAAPAEGLTVVEFDVTANKMPNGSAAPEGAGREFCHGLSVSIRDDDPAVAVSGTSTVGTTAFQVGLVEREGTMYFVYWADGAYKTVALAKNDSKQYHIRAEYGYTTTDHSQNAPVSGKYYVNGALVAEGNSVRMLGTSMSTALKNIIQLTLRPASTNGVYDDYDVVVSNMSVSHPQTLEAPVDDSFLHASYAESVDINGALDLANEPFWRRTIFLSKTLKVSAAWDWENLYLAFADTAAPNVTALTVNGKTVADFGTAGTTAREIRIPLSNVGIADINLEKEYSISFTAGGVTWNGKLVFDTSAYATEAPAYAGNVHAYGVTFSDDNWTVYMDSYDGGEGSTKQRDLYYPVIAALASDLNAPTIVEMDVTVNHFPNQHKFNSSAHRELVYGGFSVTVIDDVEVTSYKAAEGLTNGLYREDDALVFVYWDNTKGELVSVPAGSYVEGGQYHLRIEYSYSEGDGTTTDDNDIVSAKYFVNGKLIAEAENVKRFNGDYGALASNSVVIMTADYNTTDATATEATAADVTVANLSVTHPQTLEAPVDDVFLHASYAESVDVNGTLDLANEPFWRRTIFLSKTLKVSAAWDWENLYLAFVDDAAPAVTALKVNGKSVTDFGTAGTTAREIKISLSDVGIESIDFAEDYILSFTVGDVTWEGMLVFDTSAYATTAPAKSEAYGVTFSADGWTAYMDSYDGGSGTTRQRDLYWPIIKALASDLNAPTIVEMDVTVNHFPNQHKFNSSAHRELVYGGFSLTVIDDVELTGTTATEGLTNGLYREDDALVFVYWDNTNGELVSVPAGSYVEGGQYHLRIEYSYSEGNGTTTDDNDIVSAKYFVNGKLIAEAENVKRFNGNYGVQGSNSVVIMTADYNTTDATATEATAADVTVANLSVTHPQTMEAPTAVGGRFLFASHEPNDVIADGKLSDAAWKLDIPLSASLKLGAAWDWDNLYLGFSSTSATVSAPTALKIGGKDVQFDFTASDNTAEVKIPLTEVLAAVPDDSSEFADTYSVTLTIDGTTWEGALVFDTRAYKALSGSPDYGTEPAPNGLTAYFATSGSTYSAGNKQYLGYSNVSALTASTEASTVVEFDMVIHNLPAGGKLLSSGSAYHRDFCYGGVGVTLLDDKISFNSDNKATQAFQLGFFRDAGGVLQFAYWADGGYNSVAVTETTSNQYFVRTEYHYAGNGTVSADYYVNGVYVASAKNARVTTTTNFSATQSKLIMVIAQGTASQDEYKTVTAKQAKVDFSNMSVSKTQVLEKPADLDSLTKEYIFGRIDLNHVRNDLPLIETFTGKSSKVYDLQWVIGDSSVVTETGKVTRDANESRSTTITLKVAGEELWTVTVTVDPMSVKDQASSANVDAAFSASEIVIDGIISEEGWRMGGRVLDSNDHITAEYAFQWNQTTLFAAVDFVADVGTLTLVLNGKSFTVENGELLLNSEEVTGAEIAVNNGVVELAIPLSVLDMGDKVSEYGKSMAISVTANGFTGAGQELALTGIDWFVTDNRDHEAPNSGTKSTDAEHGVSQLENGWRLYDLYKEGGTNNNVEIRSYVIYNKLPIYVENFENRTVANRVEFDFLAEKMPVQNEAHLNTGAFSNSGFTFSLGDLANADKDSWSMVCGIMNTENGLEFVQLGSKGHVIVPLNKQLGELFTIAVEWYGDNHVELYVDGVLVESFAAAGMYNRGIGNASLCLNMKRVKILPTSSADDFDVSVTNLAMGKVYNNEEILSRLTFDDIKGNNASEDTILYDLVLPATTTNGQLDVEHAITWTSSNEEAISTAGKVTRPATGAAIVTLTATLSNGVSKRFELIVHGQDTSNDGVLCAIGDTNPATGKGYAYSELLFTFDTNNNSIIRDLGSKQNVNFAVLTDGDDRARLNAESLTLWVSDDNVTYTQVESFKLLHVDNQWFLYDFLAECRYVKVHYTHFEGTDADFIGAFGAMIEAGYEEVFGYGDIESTTTQYTLTNTTGKTQYDYAWTISKTDLGITGSDASIRISLNDELLYHYVDDDNVVVRVPEVTDSVTLTVRQSGSTEAIDIANKEAVHEVTYGYRETYSGPRKWVLSLPAGTTFPDGSKLEKETIFGMGSNVFFKSTDGGHTWTQTNVLNNAPEGKTPVTNMNDGGFIYDSETGRIMFQTYKKYVTFNPLNKEESHMETYVVASDDGGKTWYMLSTLPCACNEAYAGQNLPRYALSYTDGTQLSTYDGEAGSGIDFVFPLGTQYDSDGCFASRVVYTRDAGKTWEYSVSEITYPSTGSEGGCSEAYIVEREDGVLLLHVRCQAEGAYNFKVSYSYDHGVTWTNDHIFTDYYATNGQAMIKRMELNGEEAALMAIWQGNNMMGGTSYIRSPLNVAISTNDGVTFRNIQNLASKTFMEGYDYRFRTYMTNQSLAKFGGDNLILTYRRSPHSDHVTMLVHDFDQWYTRTKGAYDNFEHGVIQYEGWSVIGGTTELSETNARDQYSMKISGNGTSATRSIPYLQNGKISVDIYVGENSSFTLALQSAYSTEYRDLATPVRLRVEGGKLYLGDEKTSVATLNTGWNTLTFDLELTEKKAAVAVNNGEFVDIPVNTDGVAYACYITFGAQTDIYVDDLLVADLDDSNVCEQSEEDVVMQKIASIGIVTVDSEEKIAEARAAYSALTSEQQAKVVNYDDLLAAEERIAYLKKTDFSQASVTLKDYVGAKFYVEIDNSLADYENAYMMFTTEKGTVKVTEYETAEDGSRIYTYPLNAKQMTDVVTAQFVYDDGQSATRSVSYSVKQYAQDVLNSDDYEKYSAELRQLVMDMLQYGSYAQKQFDYKSDALAITGIDGNGTVASSIENVKTEDLTAYKAQVGTNILPDVKLQATLILKENTVLRFYFKGEALPEDMTVKVNGEERELTKSEDGVWYVDQTGIVAKELHEYVTLTVTVGEQAMEVKYSPLSYCYDVLSRQASYSENLVDLVRSLYNYNRSAVTYFATVENQQ